jgi:hypothetical protein
MTDLLQGMQHLYVLSCMTTCAKDALWNEARLDDEKTPEKHDA